MFLIIWANGFISFYSLQRFCSFYFKTKGQVDLKTIVEQARTRTSRGFCIESAAWDGGRLLPDSGTDKVLYYVTDHLVSTRVVKGGSGSIRQRYDYYPYGSVARS